MGLRIVFSMALVHKLLLVLIASASSAIIRERTVFCPRSVSHSHPGPDYQNIKGAVTQTYTSGRRARFTVRNPNPDMEALLFRVFKHAGIEKYVGSVPPGEKRRIQSFIGDRIIIRDAKGKALIDHTVGFYSVQMDPSVPCTGIKTTITRSSTPTRRLFTRPTAPMPALVGRRPNKNVGPTMPKHNVFGVVNEHPCDLTVSWVYSRFHSQARCGDRWVADLKMGTAPHRENTFDYHEFIFKLPTGEVVDSYRVQPLIVPKCDGRRVAVEELRNTRRQPSILATNLTNQLPESLGVNQSTKLLVLEAVPQLPELVSAASE